MNGRARPTEYPSDVGSQPAVKIRRRASSSARRGGGPGTPHPHTTHPLPDSKLIVPVPTGAPEGCHPRTSLTGNPLQPSPYLLRRSRSLRRLTSAGSRRRRAGFCWMAISVEPHRRLHWWHRYALALSSVGRTADISFDPQCGQRGSSIGWRDSAETAPETSTTAWGDCRWDAISEIECRRCGSGCPALSASGPTPIGRTGAAVGCELFVWLDRPITTAVAAAPRQAYGSTLNGRLQAHRSDGRAETTLGRNREPNRGIGHWLAFGWQRYNRPAAFTVRAIPYRSRSRRRWR